MPIIVYVRVHINIRIEYTSCFVKKTVFEHIILICFLLQVMSSGGSALNPLEELEQNLGEVTVHAGFRCDGCDVEPIVGSRFQGWAIDIDHLLHTVFHEATSV